MRRDAVYSTTIVGVSLMDATRKFPEEGFTRDWPRKIEMDAATKASVDAVWGKLGL